MNMEPTHQIRGTFIRNVARYIQRAIGEDALEELLGRTGLSRVVLEREFANEWRASAEMDAVLEVALELTQDRDLGRRIGEQAFYEIPDAYPFLIGTGSIGAAVVEAVNIASRSRVRTPFEVREVTSQSVTVVGDGSSRGYLGCGITQGFWSQIPSLFGAVGSVVELQCESRGDSHCEYLVRWEFPATARGVRSHTQQDRRESLLRRYEQMHAMAAEFANTTNIEQLLPAIARKAAAVVAAPFSIVAIEPPAEVGLWNIGSYGLTKKEAERMVAAYHETGKLPTTAAHIISPIRPEQGSYGYIIALQQDGIPIRSHDQRMLNAFTAFAAPSIETAQAMEASCLERDAAWALLQLSHSLAKLTDVRDIAREVSRAVPYVVPCDETSVLRWCPDDGTMTILGSWPRVAPAELQTFPVDEAGSTWELVTKHVPVTITSSTASQATKSYITERTVDSLLAVPIVVQGELFGMVTAGLKGHEQRLHTEKLVERLSGIADQAALAFYNALLLRSAKHQATHDALTGLPNRTMMEQYLAEALEGITSVHSFVTAMFIDLDGFKEVNDLHGHLVGDSVLRTVAERLETGLGPSGVVGRLGGDEFLAVLRAPGQAAQSPKIAQTLLSALIEPIQVGALTVTIGASIGIASTNNPKGDKVALLRAADKAMYLAKESGRNSWHVA